MAVTSKNLRSVQHATRVATPVNERLHLSVYVVTLLLAAVALYAIVSVVLGGASVLIDDIRYGRPRTDQLSAYVEHGETPGKPTQIMALNLNRQVVIIEIPGSDPEKTRTLTGPYLFGANENLTPVTLSLRDVDGDGKTDLLVDIRREQIVYLNRDGAFRLPNADEQAQLYAEQR